MAEGCRCHRWAWTEPIIGSIAELDALKRAIPFLGNELAKVGNAQPCRRPGFLTSGGAE